MVVLGFFSQIDVRFISNKKIYKGFLKEKKKFFPAYYNKFVLVKSKIFDEDLSKKKIEYSELINLAIIVEDKIKYESINNIISELKKISTELNFISMSKTNTNTTINIEIRPKQFHEIIKVTDLLKEKFKKSKIIIARNNNLSLWF